MPALFVLSMFYTLPACKNKIFPKWSRLDTMNTILNHMKSIYRLWTCYIYRYLSFNIYASLGCFLSNCRKSTSTFYYTSQILHEFFEWVSSHHIFYTFSIFSSFFFLCINLSNLCCPCTFHLVSIDFLNFDNLHFLTSFILYLFFFFWI